MTINEAVDAARKCQPIMYEDPFSGPGLYGRIAAVRKRFAAPQEIARGKPAESYSLELLDMQPMVNSVIEVDPALVRLPTTEELMDYENYKREA